MTARASIILWSAGSGLLLGLFVDALLVALWLVASSVIPALGRTNWPRWIAIAGISLLVVLPIAAAVVGGLEGKLKTS